MEYIPGQKNPVADALSRVEINSIHLGIDYNALADAQQSDPETDAYRTAITGLRWADVPSGDQGRTLLCDTSTGRPRPLVPRDMRRQVFDLTHGLSHPSGRSTAKLMSKRFVWLGINKDARDWSRSCTACQTSKIHRHTESGTGYFPQPTIRFSHLHVDIVGPLAPSEGYQYLFTSTERSTRWPESVPMTEATAHACAEALLYNWVSRFGVPEDITSDRGPAFVSQLWTALAQLMGTSLHRTTAYNPAANGMAERTHRTLKAALMARCTGPDWKSQLPWVLLGLRTTPQKWFTRETIAVPGEFFPTDLQPATNKQLAELRRTVGKYRSTEAGLPGQRRTRPTDSHPFRPSCPPP